MNMTAKESKAVAWRYRDRHEAEADVWNYFDLPPLMTYDYVEPLCLQSALHAAEAELGELRRRVGEIAGGIAIYAGDEEGSRLDRLAAHWEKQLRQLLASDGGADGDDEGEGK